MLLDLTRPTLAPQSLVLVLREELLDQALAERRRGGVVGETGLVAEDIGEGCVAVRAFEGSAAVEHLVDEDTDGPPEKEEDERLSRRKGKREAYQSTAEL
jgi:hypothetical protein